MLISQVGLQERTASLCQLGEGGGGRMGLALVRRQQKGDAIKGH